MCNFPSEWQSFNGVVATIHNDTQVDGASTAIDCEMIGASQLDWNESITVQSSTEHRYLRLDVQ